MNVDVEAIRDRYPDWHFVFIRNIFRINSAVVWCYDQFQDGDHDHVEWDCFVSQSLFCFYRLEAAVAFKLRWGTSR